jgi:predicted porin
MKQLLLGTTSVAGMGLAAFCAGPAILAGAAWAEEPIQLSVGGFFRSAYMVVIDDNEGGEDFIEPGFDRNLDGFFSDAEIHFKGRTVLDNGLEVGARVELEGESESEEGGDQVDEAWIYFAGGFGEFRIGSEDEALAQACILPPGGTANFSAFSPNQWGANAFSPVSNSACTGVDNRSDAQKILYISPVLAGFQLTASYTPDENAERHTDDAGPHLGMNPKSFGDAEFGTSVYLTFQHDFGGFDLTLGGGASFGADPEDFEGFVDFDNEAQDFYQGAIVVNVGRFSIGGVLEYYNDFDTSEFEINSDSSKFSHDIWVAGGGIAYAYNAWTFGAQYSYREDVFRTTKTSFDSRTEQQQQRAVVTVEYVLGPGINLDAEIGYTWRDEDPEDEFLFATDDDYEGLEIGLGTALRF